MSDITKPGWHYNNAYKVYVAETRNPDGTLNTKDYWNPFGIAAHQLSERRVISYYMANRGATEPGDVTTISNFYAEQGLCIRPKTW